MKNSYLCETNKCRGQLYSKGQVGTGGIEDESGVERDKWIEKDNMNLLQKLEDIKRKGTVSEKITNQSYVFLVNCSWQEADKPPC